jgi:hypothetical protein
MTLVRRGRMRRGAIVLGSAFPAMAEVLRGMWRSPAHRRWLVPLILFLCLTGLLLVMATTVEALAPFIYSIF